MTVIVETPEGIKSGFAVREITAIDLKFLRIFPGSGAQAYLKGEAVVVDLGHRGVLFALLKGFHRGHDHAAYVLYDIFPRDGGYISDSGIKHYRALSAGPVSLSETYYPLFVTFNDLSDPKTVTPVLEMTETESIPRRYVVSADHFEKLFGPGVRLKQVLIEMTKDPITWRVEQYIPWLRDYRWYTPGREYQTRGISEIDLNGSEFLQGKV